MSFQIELLMLSSDRHKKRIAGQILVYFCCLILLGNCGFKPLHSKKGPNFNHSVINAMARVTVPAIPERAGQLVRNKLLDRLHIKSVADKPLFRLTVSLEENREGIAFQQDDSATRFNLNLTAQFELTKIHKSESLLKGKARAIAAYNVVRSDYANIINQRDALKRASESVADNIQTQIGVYFHRLIK